jgi:hypothetical protein
MGLRITVRKPADCHSKCKEKHRWNSQCREMVALRDLQKLNAGSRFGLDRSEGPNESRRIGHIKVVL